MVQLQEYPNKGTVRLMPKTEQTVYCRTYKYKEHPFLCFKNRGIQISKNLVMDYNKTPDGEQVATQPFDFDEVIEYFKGRGFEVIDETTKAGKEKAKKVVEKSRDERNEVYTKEIKGQSTAAQSVAPNN